VSSVNPLAVLILDSGGPTEVARNVIGFTADIAGDETGPGTLTLSGGAVSVASGTYVVSVDRTFIVRSGGGMSSRDLTPGTDLATLANVRSVVANFWQDTVPEHPDGRFHAHVGPTALGQLFTDNEFQRLLTSLPDYYMYKSFAIGELLNTAFYRNSECPVVSTVVGGNLNVYDVRDPFAGELTVTGLAGGGQINRMLFTAQGCVSEYYADLNSLITEAGVTGRVGEASISNNGIEVNSERIQMVIRAPLDRLQQKVSTSWKLIADWPIRTDAATGSAARIKRVCVLESAT
jgi:hypothetical protein